MTPVETVEASTISDGPAIRMDERRTSEHVRLIAESVDKLPPLIVHRRTMRLIDGALRLAGALDRGQTFVPVQFFDGSEADAYALAVQVNVSHGLPLSTTERKAAAARLIQMNPDWSDRLVAATTGLSHKTVGVERKRVTGDGSQLNSRVGRDGKTRPLVATEGRRIAAEVIQDNPTASLREIAKIAGVSTGTVRDVRARLSRGESPVPTRGDDRSASTPDGEQPTRTQDRPTTPRPEPRPKATHQPQRSATPIQLAILQALRSDPSLRFSIKGRSILRLVGNTVNDTSVAERVLLEAPSHCHSSLAQLARANARFWNEMANRLEDR